MRNMMYTMQLDKNAAPYSLRYPRGAGVMPEWRKPMKEMKIGTGQRIRNGNDVAILTFGPIGNLATDACNTLEAEGISAAHYDMRFAKPIDEVMLHEVFTKFKKIITVEDGCIQGGIGSAILEFMGDHGYTSTVNRLGIPDRLVEHGSQAELYRECEYDAQAMVETAKKLMSKPARSMAG